MACKRHSMTAVASARCGAFLGVSRSKVPADPDALPDPKGTLLNAPLASGPRCREFAQLAAGNFADLRTRTHEGRDQVAELTAPAIQPCNPMFALLASFKGHDSASPSSHRAHAEMAQAPISRPLRYRSNRMMTIAGLQQRRVRRG